MYKEYLKERKKYYGERTVWQEFLYFCNEVNAIGSILLVGALTMLLLPFVLVKTWDGWIGCKRLHMRGINDVCCIDFDSKIGPGRTLGTLIAGVVTWVILIVWEVKYAENPVLPINRWPNKTAVYGALAVSTVTIVSSTNWLYLSTYFQVTRRISPGKATLLSRGYNVAYIVVQVVDGLLMMKTKVWRPYVWTGIALMILGIGLIIPARYPNSSDVLIVFAEVIAGLGSGMMDIPITVAIQSTVPHESKYKYFRIIDRLN